MARLGPFARERVPRTGFRTAVAALAVTLGAVTVGCAAGDVPEAPTDDPQLVEGQALWTANCASCHGMAGDGGAGPKLSDGQVVARYPEVEDQAAVVADGVRAMPGFSGKLDDDQIDAVVAYTREVLDPAG